MKLTATLRNLDVILQDVVRRRAPLEAKREELLDSVSS